MIVTAAPDGAFAPGITTIAPAAARQSGGLPVLIHEERTCGGEIGRRNICWVRFETIGPCILDRAGVIWTAANFRDGGRVAQAVGDRDKLHKRGRFHSAVIRE